MVSSSLFLINEIPETLGVIGHRGLHDDTESVLL